MTQSFEEFLKDNVLKFPWDYEPVVTIKDLGEWALKSLKEQMTSYNKGNYENSWEQLDGEEQDSLFYLREIAIACLEKAEIEKRLAQLTKQERGGSK